MKPSNKQIVKWLDNQVVFHGEESLRHTRAQEYYTELKDTFKKTKELPTAVMGCLLKQTKLNKLLKKLLKN